MRVLLRNGVLYANGPQPLSSMLIVDDRIAWIGHDVEMHDADRVIDLDGRVVVPAFVDAHVHATATGLAMVPCSVDHPSQLLDRFHPSAEVVLGHGWDDTTWPSGWFSRTDLDNRVGNTLVYASRIDVHSAIVSSALLDRVPRELDGWSDTGVLTRAAHAHARMVAFGALSDQQRITAQQRTLALAAELGIACLHEMSGPAIASYHDAELLLAQTGPTTPQVALWWGELHGFERARALGAYGIGGDLVIDGSVGSRTAAFCDDYHDHPTRGASYQESDELVAHIAAAVDAGIPTAFHAIGDAAVAQIVSAYRQVVESSSIERFSSGLHRIEHCELARDEDLRTIAELGIIASVQPQFDAEWGGHGGMYAQRLGPERASRMNRFASMAKAGIRLAFGSDSPVTALDPWGSVHAAQFHRTPGESLTQRAAIAAHTRGGWRAIGVETAGVLAEGWDATFAVWETDGESVAFVDDRIARWSTDPRAGVPRLPDMRNARCVMTVRRGEVLFDALS